MRRTLGLIGMVVALVASVTMTAAAVTPTATERHSVCTASPFPDVPTDNPFCDEIAWLDEHDIAGGFPDGTFRPATTVSRQSMAVFLYRLRGAPRGEDPQCAAAPFPDVPTSHPFCGEITWLADAGIAGGFPDGTYRPTTTITRQFMSAFLYRMADARRGPNPACGHKPFADVTVANDFCGEIAWLKARGVVQGDGAGRFRPGDPVSRQAMAGFLHQLDATTGIQGGATPLDFDLDGDADLAFVDDHQWYRAGEAEPFWAPTGEPGPNNERQVPGDYNGNGTTEPAMVLADGTWETGGLGGDFDFPPPPIDTAADKMSVALPVPGDYDGDGATDPAWYDGYTGTWYIQGAPAPIAFGTGEDEAGPLADAPAPGDYDGDGTTDLAVYSPADANLSIRHQSPVDDLALGLPITADLEGDGADDLVVYDTHNIWHLPDGTTLEPGLASPDSILPLVLDLDGDGALELAHFDYDDGIWFDLEGDELATDARAGSGAEVMGIVYPTLLDFIRFTWLIECLPPDGQCSPNPWE